ncbi:MAG: hypothetical protein AAFR33_13505, partial [Pseudomonadota bacterium]
MTPEEIAEEARRRREGGGGVDEVLRAARERRASQAAGSLYTTDDLDPDTASNVVDLAERRGVDFEYARRQREALEEADRQELERRTLEQSPRLSQHFARPERAAVARDSIMEMAEIERRLRGEKDRPTPMPGLGPVNALRNVLADPQEAATQTGDLGRSSVAGFQQAFASAIRGLGEMSRAAGQMTEDTLRGVPGLDAVFDAEDRFLTQTDAGQMVNQASPEALARGLGNYYAGVAQSSRPDEQGIEDQIAEGLGQMLAAVLTTTASGGTSTATIGFGGMGADTQAQRMRGLGIDPADRPGELALGATVTGASEALRLNSIMRAIPPKLRQSVAQSAMARIAGQGIEEGSQEFIENVAQNLIAMGYDEEAKLLEGAGESAGIGAATGSIFQAIIEVAIPGRIRGSAAEAGADTMTKVRDAIEATPVFDRRRQDVREFVESATDGQTVFLDGEALNTLAQADGGAFARIQEDLGLTDEQMTDAMTGQDVEVPAAKLLTVEERSQYEQLLEITRMEPDAVTLAEAREQASRDAMQVDFEEVQRAIELETEALVGFERVQQSVQRQLVDAGRSVEEAEAVGAIWGSVFRVFEEDGIDTEAVFERLGLRIESPNMRPP